MKNNKTETQKTVSSETRQIQMRKLAARLDFLCHTVIPL